jgi:hypothetical protein
MNTNPTLLMGQALAWLDAQPEGKQPREHDRRYVTLRVYPPDGAGYFFVEQHSANRWYYKEESDADHFSRVEQSEIDGVIAVGGRVQIAGVRGESFGVWPNWQAFVAAVLH